MQLGSHILMQLKEGVVEDWKNLCTNGKDRKI